MDHQRQPVENYGWTTGGDPQFRHIEALAHGSFGWVHKLRDSRSNTYFARKLIQTWNADGEWENERRAVQKLCHVNAHRNIVAVLRTGRFLSSGAPVYYLDMELCDLTLAAYIDRDWTNRDLRKKVPNFVGVEQLPLEFQLAQIRDIMKDVTSGVAFIHSHKEVHRDLKPKNILYSCESDAWKIADFGFTVQGSSTDANTDFGRGTPGYRAPELVIKQIFNNKSDIWTLGCIWFEVMHREQAFTGDLQVVEFARSVDRRLVPRTDGFWDDDMESLLHTMLDPDPVHRPSAMELIDHFEDIFRNAINSVKPQVQDPTWEEIFSPEDKEMSYVETEVLGSEDSEAGVFIDGTPELEDHTLDVAVSVSGDSVFHQTLLENADSWAIAYANQIILNSSNTFFAAVVTLQPETPAKGSCEQVQLWETETGTVVWRWRLPTPDILSPSFGPDGRYFCFHDGQNLSIVDTSSHPFSKKELILLPSEASSDLDDFEWNLRNHGLSSFTVNTDATRVALASIDSSSEEISVSNVFNQSGGFARHVDRISIPSSSNGRNSKRVRTTLRYSTSTGALFVVWENEEGVIVESFDPRSKQQLSHIGYQWIAPHDWEDPIRVYGITRSGLHECLVLSVPAKVPKNATGGRFLPRVPGRKIIMLSVHGHQIAELKKFPGKSSVQSHDIILSNERATICCQWNKGNVLMQIWHTGSFRKLDLFSVNTPTLPSRSYRCAFRDSQLTMFSPQGDIHVLRMESHA